MKFLIYFFKKIVRVIISVLKHWYIDSFYTIYDTLVRTIKKLDRKWALKITLQHFFQPLYQDYTWTGYIMGVGLRLFRVVLASITYTFVLVIFIASYLAWCLVPIWIFKTFK